LHQNREVKLRIILWHVLGLSKGPPKQRGSKTVTIEYNEQQNDVSNAKINTAGADPVEIILNGEARSVPDGISLDKLMDLLEMDPSRVAVERNREIVRKPSWNETVIQAGDQIEVVWFVGGG